MERKEFIILLKKQFGLEKIEHNWEFEGNISQIDLIKNDPPEAFFEESEILFQKLGTDSLILLDGSSGVYAYFKGDPPFVILTSLNSTTLPTTLASFVKNGYKTTFYDGLYLLEKEKLIPESQKIEQVERPDIENQNVVDQAKHKFNERKWNDAIELFEESINICSKQGWIDGIRYAESMISEAKKEIYRISELKQFEVEILQEIEKLTKLNFKKIENMKEGKKMVFTVENYRITGIGLFDCRLSTFPDSITKLKSLERLNLEYNQFTTLPESIGQLSSLQELRLDFSKLKILPESIGLLKSLQTLTLDYNQLTTLPESLKNLTSLKMLWLKNNPLDSKSKALIEQLERKGVEIHQF